MTSTTRIVLAAEPEFEVRLRSAMPELNGNLERWSGSLFDLQTRGARDLVAADPEVVAFGPEFPTDAVLAVATELDRLNPDVEVVVVAEPSPRLWQRVARAGVRELVSPSAGDEELGAAVRRAIATIDARRAVSGSATPPAPGTDRGEVIVVLSPKGGSGKTMVSTNVAVTLAKAHPGEVAIVDLDLQFGDVATALGLTPEYTISDATANAELTPTTLKALLSTHSSHVHALCAPTRPADADEITGPDVAALLDLLRAAFRYVVVDTAGGLDEHALAAVDVATDMVLICSMDVSSVRALRKELETLDAADLTTARRHLVLNRANSRVGLEVRHIEETVGARVDVQIASSRSVPLNMNCGIPLVDAEPSSPVSRQLKDLAGRLVPALEPARSRRWRR